MDFDVLRKLRDVNKSKIVYLVMDGLGGLPLEPGGQTELESAHTPNLDKLASEAVTGLHQAIGPGITPGSGPAHLALFGYDPLKYTVGRGVLSALGIDFDLQPGDVAARGNFCTVDENGVVTDRRAGRISTEENIKRLELMKDITLPGVEVHLRPVKEYRFLLVLRGEGLDGALADTDPQDVGEKPLPARALQPAAQKTAKLVDNFVAQAGKALAGHEPANMVLLRGFAQRPNWPTLEDIYGIRSIAIAAYPMYRGVARLLGMQCIAAADSLEQEIDMLEQHWEDYDFFFVHAKKIDSYGEDGNFQAKAQVIEQVDALIPRIRALNPDVIIVTGDHSTPAAMKRHSWHPVPVLLWSRVCRPDNVTQFGERALTQGGLGPRIPAIELMPLAMANAQRFDKYGA